MRPAAAPGADRPAAGPRAAVRAWLVRGVILAGVAALAAVGWVATTWVSPERVRTQVVAALTDQFDGVEVHVGSARMRILGGIAVRDLRLVRRGDPPDRPFLVVPVAVLFHDKEQLNRGRLVIRKIQLENPTFNLERGADGRWNVADVVRPGPADSPVPTFTATGATLTVADQSPEALPPVKLTDARLTLLNDPLPVLTLHAQGAADLVGPVEVRARLNRISRQATVELKLGALPLGDLAPALAEKYAPLAATHLGKLAATAAVRADLTFNPELAPAWRHDVQIEVKDGRFEHPDLPWPAEKIALKVRSTDGRVKVEDATAKVGPAHVRLSLETREPGSPPLAAVQGEKDDPFAAVEERVQKAEVSVAGVPLDDALFARLGKAGAVVKRMFAPTGTIDLGYRFAREAAGWKRELEVRPRGVAATYEKFRYPVTAVEGSVKRTQAAGGEPSIAVDVRGKAAGEAVTVKGQIYGRGDDPGISLRVAASNIPIDETVIAALPDEYPDVVRQFRPTGRASFTADINQKYGVNLAENEFRIDVSDGTINYALFPLRFDRVKGKVVVRVAAVEPRPGAAPPPDRDEFVLDGFTAAHGPGTVWLNGAKRTVPGTADRKLDLHVGGTNCPVDDDLKAALAALKLDEVWTSFAPRGTLAFSADVEVMDRAPPPGVPAPKGAAGFDPAADLSLTFNFYGPTVTPAFFPYDLTDLSGWLRYRAGRVDVAHVAARHGETKLRLEAGEVRFYPKGVVWANLGKLEAKNVVADEALLAAVPASLRGGVEGLKLRGRADLEVKHLVVLTPPDAPPEPAPVARAQAPAALPVAAPSLAPPPPPDPVVYWDAELKLAGASLDTGLAWEEVFGAVACRGRYEGTHLGLVRGNVYLDRAVIARQPVGVIQGRLQVLPQQPDPARPGYYQPPTAEFLNLTGTLFHGTVGGEARVVLAEPTRYDLWLTATDVQLEEVARHYRLNRPGSDADLTGMAQAQVRLFNRFDPRTGQWALEGTGRVDVPTGRMYNLPVLLDLMKVLKLQTPDRTAFEEAHAAFHLKGERVYVDQLDLIGKAVCVGGSGELDLSGDNVRLEFYTLGSQILARLVNTPVGDLSAFLSRNLFVIRMTKEAGGEIRYRPEPVPLVTEPARAVVERLRRLREARPGVP